MMSVKRQKRGSRTCVRDGADWRIECDETGRAVLAYAKNVNGELAYELALSTGNSTTRRTATVHS